MCPQVNKFEPVSSDGHQISLAVGSGWEVSPMSDVQGAGGQGHTGACTVRTNASWVMMT